MARIMKSIRAGSNPRTLQDEDQVESERSAASSPATAVTALCSIGSDNDTCRSLASALARTMEFLICRPFKRYPDARL